MVGRPTGQARLYFGVVIVVGLMIGTIIIFRRPETPSTNTSTNNTARESYAAYYDTLLRQDSGQGSLLLTATLFIPPMINALGQDTQRSDAEEQIWNTLKLNKANQIGVYLTLDSVAGYMADEDIKKALSLELNGGPTPELTTWKPIIGTGSPVTANVAVVSQRGLAVFTANDNIDWKTLTDVTLRASNLGDQPIRQFVWTQVGALSQ